MSNISFSGQVLSENYLIQQRKAYLKPFSSSNSGFPSSLSSSGATKTTSSSILPRYLNTDSMVLRVIYKLENILYIYVYV